MKVEAPDGRPWTVGRQWVSHRVSLRREDRPSDAVPPDGQEGGTSIGDFFDLDLDPAGILVGLAVGVVAVLALLVVWPLVALAIELVALLLVLLASVAGRVLFRRPWTVFARTDGPPADTVERQAVGWRASGRLREELAETVRSGRVVPAEGGEKAPLAP